MNLTLSLNLSIYCQHQYEHHTLTITKLDLPLWNIYSRHTTGGHLEVEDTWRTLLGFPKSQYAITQKDCILAASLAQIVNEVRTKSLVLPEVSQEDVQLNALTREWMELVRKRSSLVLAVRNFHRNVRALHSSLIALTESIRQKKEIGVTWRDQR
jgi:hypothetical protein